MMTKPLLAIISFLFAMCILFGYLSYSFYGQKQAMETQLNVALESNVSLEKSLSKQEKACKIGDGIASEFIEENKVLSLQTNDDLVKLDKLPSAVTSKNTNAAKKAPIAAKETAINEKTNVVNLDWALPAGVVRLLAENCQRSKGSTCDDS